jgi:DNA-binding transcriptional ArsR family regulator
MNLSMHAAAETLLFKTLADPTRRALFERLAREGELTVGALTRRAGVSQPAVSQHLEALRQAGLVTNRRDGRTAHYRATPRGLAPLTNWLAHYGVFWRERFDRLEKLLKEMDQ